MLNKEFKEHLLTNLLKFKEVGNNLIEVGGKIYYYHDIETPLIEDGGEVSISFDAKLTELILEMNDKLEGVVYKFGPFYMYTGLDSLNTVNLDEFKYIGEASNESYFNTFLGIHGVYERMSGVGDYKDWIKKSKFLGYDTLGICERATLAGVLQFQEDCNKKGIKPIIGYSLPIETDDGSKTDIKLYIKNKKGWVSLLKLNKDVNTSESLCLELSQILKSEGLVCVFEPGEHLTEGFVDKLSSLFDKVYIQISNKEYQSNVKDMEFLLGLEKYVKSDVLREKVDPILIHDAYCLDKEHTYLRRLLNKQGGVEFQNMTEDHYFKSSKEILMDFIKLFDKSNTLTYQKLLQKSLQSLQYIKENCSFQFEKGKMLLPEYKMSDEEKEKYGTNNELFINLLKEGFNQKITDKTKRTEAWERMVKELKVVKQGFIDYFLILWDICRWCRENGIQVGPGRGSAGGSIISYFLGITAINPLDFDLLFERFLNEGRIGGKKEEKIIKVKGEGNLDIELDFEEKVIIFRDNSELEILANEIREGDYFIRRTSKSSKTI